jgi:hypothetical protein
VRAEGIGQLLFSIAGRDAIDIVPHHEDIWVIYQLTGRLSLLWIPCEKPSDKVEELLFFVAFD